VRKREYQNVSHILKSALLRIDQVRDPPYNLVIHTSPITKTLNDFYPRHIEIMPKLSKVAGF
jgi:UDPglucose--hexose-1-phosphate uridylyltransferase